MTKQWKVLRAIAKAGAHGCTVDDLLQAVYGDDEDGGPVCARASVVVMVHKLRRRGFVYTLGRTWNARYYHNHFDGKARIVALAANIMCAATPSEYATACNKMKEELSCTN